MLFKSGSDLHNIFSKLRKSGSDMYMFFYKLFKSGPNMYMFFSKLNMSAADMCIISMIINIILPGQITFYCYMTGQTKNLPIKGVKLTLISVFSGYSPE